MRNYSTPSVLKTSRLPMDFSKLDLPSDSKIEGILADTIGEAVLPISRWLDVWSHIRHLLPRWDRLNFTMQTQQQTNWCWAATSTSVAQFYDAATTWTQCKVANGQTGRTDCCGTGASGPCNIYDYLDDALTRVGHFNKSTGAAQFQSIDNEVDGGRPVGIRVAWSGGGAHFLAIIGYLEDTTNYVAVDDPIYGKSDVSWNTITSSYQGTGSWTHTYYTKA